MKRLAMVTLVTSTLLLTSGVSATAATRDTYDDSITHPLRLAAYLVHPLAFATDWLIGRPFHYIISRPYLDKVFGYEAPNTN